jgi:hypothetical protein
VQHYQAQNAFVQVVVKYLWVELFFFFFNLIVKPFQLFIGNKYVYLHACVCRWMFILYEKLALWVKEIFSCCILLVAFIFFIFLLLFFLIWYVMLLPKQKIYSTMLNTSSGVPDPYCTLKTCPSIHGRPTTWSSLTNFEIRLS